MKLERLASTTETLSREARERARNAASAPRVEAMEGVEGDRQRSLRQELDSVEALAVGEFSGQSRQLEQARQVADQLRVVCSGGGCRLLQSAGLVGRAVRLLHLDTSA
ncbi:hypothetical protein VX159_01620 [Dechloromonas sp. ZY10]|uniref:hypothetical protein n=1 Tax=Dechloromonas aquae TaxID=2664436 RepID=UPI003527E6A3